MVSPKLGKYELHEQLGRGGFGTVYRAIDLTLGREVALKILHPAYMADPDFIERFRREARTVAVLEHPNIVTVFDLDEADGRAFIAMRYLPGGSLRDRMKKEGRIPYPIALEIVRQVAAGLQAAHARGLVHRDIKPENILFSADGQAVITDFGLAKAVQSSTSSTSSSSGGTGTPSYRAPELWRGKPPASPATDEYSLACVFCEMLSGKQLFAGETPDEIITRHVVDGAELPENWPPGVPNGLNDVLKTALAMKPEDRFTDLAGMQHALERLSVGVSQSETPAPAVLNTLYKKVEDTQASSDQADFGAAHQQIKTRLERTTQNWTENQPSSSTKKPTWLPWLIGVIGLGILATYGWYQMYHLRSTATPMATAYPTEVSYVATEAPTVVPTAEIIGSTWTRPADGMKMVYVPAGEFSMGSNNGQLDERPVHTVTLDAFWIDQTEVTTDMYARCVTAGKCQSPSSSNSYSRDSYYGDSQYADYPVIYVSWNDAVAYCAWAGAELPSEAEWEKAARGTDGRTYPWGENINNTLANYNSYVGDTTEVGYYPTGASLYGALDMAGNVWEWVNSLYKPYPFDAGDGREDVNASGPRVLRGGSWYDYEHYLRSALRYYSAADLTLNVIGFRCSRSLP